MQVLRGAARGVLGAKNPRASSAPNGEFSTGGEKGGTSTGGTAILGEDAAQGGLYGARGGPPPSNNRRKRAGKGTLLSEFAGTAFSSVDVPDTGVFDTHLGGSVLAARGERLSDSDDDEDPQTRQAKEEISFEISTNVYRASKMARRIIDTRTMRVDESLVKSLMSEHLVRQSQIYIKFFPGLYVM